MGETVNKPNFFIAGAPKCGTTAMAEYLKEHREIFMSYPKEPHYFSDDFPEYKAQKTLEGYLSLFKSAEREKIIGEASVWYLFSETAIKNIKTFNPDAKILIMLREPVSMVYSNYAQRLIGRFENVKNFEKAWELEEKRKNGECLPPFVKDAKTLYYKEMAKYSVQIERVYRYFDKKQVMIVTYDEFSRNTERVYCDVLDFLGVRQDARRYFKVINSSKAKLFPIYSDFIRGLYRKIPKSILNINSFVGRFIGFSPGAVLFRLDRINQVKRKRKPLTSMMEAEIAANYLDDVIKLNDMIENDLSVWISDLKKRMSAK